MVDMLWIPPIRLFLFLCKLVYKGFVSWWYDPWQQEKANEALWREVQAKFYYLVANGELVREKELAILPFDYASIKVIVKNLIFCFTRGQGDISVTLSPVRFPNNTYHLEWVLAALSGDKIAEVQQASTWEEIAEVLRSRLDEINESFSESEYCEFEKKLLKEKESERILIRQAEWSLNQWLYGNHKRT